MYKAYVLNCHFVNSTKLQHIQFLGNCFAELLRVDVPAAYHHAFVYIRQLVMILKEALFSPTKKKNKSKGKDEPSKKEKGKEARSSSSNKVWCWEHELCFSSSCHRSQKLSFTLAGNFSKGLSVEVYKLPGAMDWSCLCIQQRS